jgi:hypothetical protein
VTARTCRPISLDAIEQIQVNIAPFDVRQGNFVGAGVNTVTARHEQLGRARCTTWPATRTTSARTPAARTVNPGTFDFGLIGGRLGGPILKDKLFFFASVEERRSQRARHDPSVPTKVAKRPVATSRACRRTDLEQLSTFLQTNFGYETGPFQGYNFGTPSQRSTRASTTT